MAKTFKTKKFILLALPLILAVAALLFSGISPTIEVMGADGVTAFVTRMYRVTLEREPDPGGLASWTDGLRSGSLSGADVAKNFIFSEEFRAKNVSDEQFLHVMYAAFFNRAPDPGGFGGWMSELNQGRGREYVLNGFVNSEEFRALCAQYGINPGSGANVTVKNAAQPASPAPSSANLNAYEQQILAQLNAIRAAQGLGALAPSQALTDIARSRSQDMLARGYFSHHTPEGSTVFNLLRANGVGYRNAGENLAHSMPSSAGSAQVFANAWMASPSHAANILRPQYTKVGIGLAQNNGRRVVTTVFTN